MGKIWKVGMGTPPKKVDFSSDVELDVSFGRSEIYNYWCCSGCNDYFAYFSTEEKANRQWESSSKVKAYCEPSTKCLCGD
jgi:hypothetical protein